MTNHHPSEIPPKSPEKKRRFLSAEKKFQIYLEAQAQDKPVGELLRREGLFSTDLARIRQQVKEGALQRLSAKPGRKQGVISTEAYEALKHELQEKERTLAGRCAGGARMPGAATASCWTATPVSSATPESAATEAHGLAPEGVRETRFRVQAEVGRVAHLGGGRART